MADLKTFENVIAFDPGLSGGIATLSASGELLACHDLPTLGEGTQRRIDAANLAAMLRPHLPARAVIEASARPSCSNTPRRVASESAPNEASKWF